MELTRFPGRGAIAVVLSLACGSGVAVDPGEEVAEEDDGKLDSAGQPVFKGDRFKGESETTLKFKLEMSDGSKRRNKNKRFTNVKVSRGSKSFSASCSNPRGEVKSDVRSSTVSCGKGVETVSNDDDESLFFDIARETKSGSSVFRLQGVYYVGDGTFLGDEVTILVGEVEDYLYMTNEPKPLAPTLGQSAHKAPFKLLALVEDAVAPLIGKTAYEEDLDARVSVKWVEFSLDEKMRLSVTLRLGKTGRVSKDLRNVSILKTAGNLASGYATEAEILARIEPLLNH